MKLLDKFKSLGYILGDSPAFWASIRFTAGFLDKLGVGAFLIGLFQNRTEGTYLGIICYSCGLILNILIERRN